MSVLIKGMEMPKSCVLCRMSEYHVTNYCKITEAKILRNRDRNNDCPLIPVPPHGDLIDRDALKSDGFHTIVCYTGKMPYEYTAMPIDLLPTIIPAEEGEI